MRTAAQVFYDNSSKMGGRICDGSGEDSSCALSYWAVFSVYDHLHYFGETIGEFGCDCCNGGTSTEPTYPPLLLPARPDDDDLVRTSRSSRRRL